MNDGQAPWPGMTFGIGSLPHEQMDGALDLVCTHLPHCPHWPQLPSRSFLEQMEYQFSGCLPGLVVDDVARKLMLDRSGQDFPDALERFWELALAAEEGGDLDPFAAGQAYAPGLFALQSRLRSAPQPPIIKGQCTGPFTLGLGMTTTDDRALYYDDTLRDVVVRAVALQARWQARRLGTMGRSVMVAVDEPVLTSFGSTAMITVSREDVIAGLSEAVQGVHREGALVSTHCCGNTDWSMIVDAGVDILSFDAWEFAEKMGIYAAQIQGLLARGGWLAWGIVPTSPAVMDLDGPALLRRLRDAQDGLVSSGVDERLVRDRALITPSCGTGPLTVPLAQRVYALLSELGSLYASGDA